MGDNQAPEPQDDIPMADENPERISIETYVAEGAWALYEECKRVGFFNEEAFELVKLCAPMRYNFFLQQTQHEIMRREVMSQRVARRIMGRE